MELGAGLSCLRRQMDNETNPWYCLDMENVIALREKHIPKGAHEQNIICDLNDFSWFDKISFDPAEDCFITLKKSRCALCCALWRRNSPAA